MLPEDVANLAQWSAFVPFSQAAPQAPQLPGVYLARVAQDSTRVVYVGMAGERASGGTPQGLRGRLRVYGTGKAAVSGLGEAVMDRALADERFLSERLEAVRQGRALTMQAFCRAAFLWTGLEVCWATTSAKEEARSLERQVIGALAQTSLWNKAR